MEYMKASMPKWVNSILDIIWVNSLKLGGLHTTYHKFQYAIILLMIPLNKLIILIVDIYILNVLNSLYSIVWYYYSKIIAVLFVIFESYASQTHYINDILNFEFLMTN